MPGETSNFCPGALLPCEPPRSISHFASQSNIRLNIKRFFPFKGGNTSFGLKVCKENGKVLVRDASEFLAGNNAPPFSFTRCSYELAHL